MNKIKIVLRSASKNVVGDYMADNRVLVSVSEDDFNNLIDCILIAEEEFIERGMLDEVRELENLRLHLQICVEY